LGIGGRLNGAGVGDGGDGSSGGVICKPGSIGMEADGRADDGREPMVVELEEESIYSIFLHSALRVEGIIPSTLHPDMCFRLKAISHAGLKHPIICS
jgi:hypothetical protein